MTDTPHYLKTELYEKLRNDPNLFTWIEQGSLDGIWYWDLEDGQQEWLSPRFNQVFGFEADEIPHTIDWWQKNIFPDDLQLALDNFQKHVKDANHPYDQIVRYRHRNGSTVWVRCRGLVIKDEFGKPIRMLGAHTDVTKLKEAEIALEEKQKELERSNAELEKFAFIASHDLKSPVTAIRRLIGWIEEDCGEELPQQAKENFGLIKSRSKRLSTLLDDLLEYSRVGQQNFVQEALSLKAEAFSVFELLHGSENFALNVSDIDVCVARTPLHMLLNNLLSNAIKHHDKTSGKISIRCKVLADIYLFEIEDDGPGIQDNMHERVFELFQTLKPRDEVEGSGMGLSILQKMMTTLGGEISLKPNSGRGTVFIVKWPKSL